MQTRRFCPLECLTENPDSLPAFRIIFLREADDARVVVMENITIEPALRLCWWLPNDEWQTSIEPMPNARSGDSASF